MSWVLKAKEFLGLQSPAAGISFDSVFQEDFPVEAWEEAIRSQNLKREIQESLLHLVRRVLEKTPADRKELTEILCKPMKLNPFSNGPDEIAKRDVITRQVVIDTLSTSENNLHAMKEALERIIGNV